MGKLRSRLLILALVLAGCGSDDETPTPGGGPPTRKVD